MVVVAPSCEKMRKVRPVKRRAGHTGRRQLKKELGQVMNSHTGDIIGSGFAVIGENEEGTKGNF